MIILLFLLLFAFANDAKAQTIYGNSTKRSLLVANSGQGQTGQFVDQNIVDAFGSVPMNYSYSPTPSPIVVYGPFAPMIEDPAHATSGNLSIAQANGDTLLPFNEPDNQGVSVATALSYWPTFEATGMRLSSPAVSNYTAFGKSWLDSFMNQAIAAGRRVDFVNFHYYAFNSGYIRDPVGAADELIRQVNELWTLYQRPIWITEFAQGYGGSEQSNYASLAENLAFMQNVLPRLEALPYVEKYFWWTPSKWGCVYADSTACLADANGNLNSLGIFYREINSSGPQAPSTPTGVAAVAGNGQVSLKWNASSGTPANYIVKRSLTSGSGYATISNPAGTSYTDKSVTNGTTYYYVVTAVNASGESNPSFEVSATPTSSQITWRNNSTGATGGTTGTLPNWQTDSAITLQPGANDICVTYGPATDCITVTYQLPVGSVTIMAPVQGPRYITTVQAQAVSGNASCPPPSNVQSISWTNDQGGKGSATGGANWNFTSTLTPDRINTLTVDLVCSAGQTATASFQVAYSPPELIAAYSFDENTGTSVTDLSTKGNNGTFGAGVTWSAPGKYGTSALNFSGGHVTINNSSTLDIVGGFTLSAWVNPNTPTNVDRSVIAKSTNEYLYAEVEDRPNCPVNSSLGGFKSGTAFNEVCKPLPPIPPGVFTCLAVTYDGLTLTLYVNQTPVVSSPQNYDFPVQDTGTLQIGDSFWGAPFAGKIDEVRVYKYARSAAQVGTDCDTQIGAPPAAPPSGLKLGSVGVRVGGLAIGVGQ